MEFKQESFLPVILGADITAYSLARSFHEEYGVKSLVLSKLSAKIISKSKIIENRCFDGLDDPEVLVKTLTDVGKEFQGKKTLVILGCGDWYVRAIAENRAALEPYYVIPYINLELLDKIVLKEKFYEICDELNIDHPRTFVYDCVNGTPLDFDFEFPVIAKTANSAKYHYAKFEGKRKVFCFKTREELETMMERIKNSNYDDKFLIQECIPGDDHCMRVLTCYCDKNSKVRFASLGHVLLEDHTPTAIGNPVAIINEVNPEIVDAATRFLEHVGYTGFANFDLKYDSRDGKYKFFEINVRLGRSNFYVTGSGFNTVKCIIDDMVLGKELKYTVADRENLFSVVPMGVIKKYCTDPAMVKKAVQLKKQGRYSHPLLYSADTDAVRKAYVYAALLNQNRKFKNNAWLLK